jgi:hypothetical protein
MQSGGNLVKTLAGSGIATGSSLLAIADPGAWWVTAIVGIGGLALGVVGIYQRMQDDEIGRLRKRVADRDETIDALEHELRQARHDAEDSQDQLKRIKGPAQ